MKKKLILLMVALSTLCACDSEMTTEEQIGTQSLAASKVEHMGMKGMFIPQGYSPLGSIPQDALSKMSEDEKNFWSEMSKTFYIDYSVLDNVAYTKDKKKFMQRWREHVIFLKDNGIESSIMIIPSSRKKMHKITRMKTSSETIDDSFDDTEVKEDFDKTVYTYNDLHYCPRNSFNISKSNKLIVTHQN